VQSIIGHWNKIAVTGVMISVCGKWTFQKSGELEANTLFTNTSTLTLFSLPKE
jgi:hypothetical protein